MKNYPEWSCWECGIKHGTKKERISTWHFGKCDVCNQNKMNDQFEFEFSPTSKLAKKFELFHASNPNVYNSLVDLARKFKIRNRSDKIGIAMLYEVLRWEYYLSTDSQDDYKLCNNYKAFYARLIMQNEPDLQGIFNLKRSVADNENI